MQGGVGRAISESQLLPKPRLTATAKAKQSQRPSSVPSFLPPVVLDHSKVFFSLPSSPSSSPYFFHIFPDDRLLHILHHRRPLIPKDKWFCAQWFKSFPLEQPPFNYPHHPQEAHGIRRFRKPSKPGPPQEREEGLSVHRNGRWCVPSEMGVRSALFSPSDPS